MGTFWFGYEFGWVRFGLYSLTDTIYKFKVHDFLTYIDRVRFEHNMDTFWYGYISTKMWVCFDQKWVRFGWVRFG